MTDRWKKLKEIVEKAKKSFQPYNLGDVFLSPHDERMFRYGRYITYKALLESIEELEDKK